MIFSKATGGESYKILCLSTFLSNELTAKPKNLNNNNIEAKFCFPLWCLAFTRFSAPMEHRHRGQSRLKFLYFCTDIIGRRGEKLPSVVPSTTTTTTTKHKKTLAAVARVVVSHHNSCEPQMFDTELDSVVALSIGNSSHSRSRDVIVDKKIQMIRIKR